MRDKIALFSLAALLGIGAMLGAVLPNAALGQTTLDDHGHEDLGTILSENQALIAEYYHYLYNVEVALVQAPEATEVLLTTIDASTLSWLHGIDETEEIEEGRPWFETLQAHLAIHSITAERSLTEKGVTLRLTGQDEEAVLLLETVAEPVVNNLRLISVMKSTETSVTDIEGGIRIDLTAGDEAGEAELQELKLLIEEWQTLRAAELN